MGANEHFQQKNMFKWTDIFLNNYNLWAKW